MCEAGTYVLWKFQNQSSLRRTIIIEFADPYDTMAHLEAVFAALIWYSDGRALCECLVVDQLEL